MSDFAELSNESPLVEGFLTMTDEDENNLIRHAREEMRLAGLYDEDADYGGMLPEAVLNVVRSFSSEGHSGGSAAIVSAILEKVLRFEHLTPLTSDPSEWNEVSRWLWQSRRNPAFFSTDRGESWYTVSPSSAEFGDRCFDGGELGTIIRCPECGGSGQLHAPDEPPPAGRPA